mmetsp:Transcript_19748/g.48518  ORF Transcript_19748/g.48518 Transcript_19748/m.48518 type:complete len:301 (+) Transcript_19748:61-963(+)
MMKRFKKMCLGRQKVCTFFNFHHWQTRRLEASVSYGSFQLNFFLIAKGIIQDIQCSVEALESINELFFRDAEWRRAVNVWVSVQSDQSILKVGVFVLVESCVSGFVLQFGVGTIHVMNIKAPKHADCTVLLDARVVVGELLHAGFKQGGHICGSSNNVLFDQILDILVGNGHGNRMGLVSGSPAEWLVFEKVHNFFATGSHGHGDGSGRNSLRGRDNIGHDTFVVLESKKLSSTAESDHDFINVHENTVFVAKSANSLHVAWWHDEASSSSNNRFHHDRGNIVGTFIQNLFLQHVQCGLD